MSYILKGIGDSVTGKNEISPQFDAKINNFLVTLSPCVVGSENSKFTLSIIDRGVTISPGMAFAFGYFGLSDATVQFNYLIPSSQTQYSKVYAEFDLSKTPQAFSIKSTPQTENSVINLLSDNLNELPSGVYQLPLYLITINTNGTVTYKDLRVIKNTIGEINLSNATSNPIYTGSKGYRPLKYENHEIKTVLQGVEGDTEVALTGRVLIWRSPNWRGIGTKIPGNGSNGYLAIEFEKQGLYGDYRCYEIVIDYAASLPESLVKIPKAQGCDYWYEGGRMHIFVSPFTAPAGQPNIICYPLGTLTNWSSGDSCGSGSALLICERYLIDNVRGLCFQYIERVGNTNQAQNECALIEIYGII